MSNAKNPSRATPVIEYYPGTTRPLVRPRIRYGKAILFFLTVMVINVVLSVGAQHLFQKSGAGFFFLCFSGLCLLSLLLFGKRIAIFFVRVYQRYVSYDIRSRCCLVPSCSEYMILAIQKYGLIRGFRKGYARMHRCGTTDITEDYP